MLKVIVEAEPKYWTQDLGCALSGDGAQRPSQTEGRAVSGLAAETKDKNEKGKANMVNPGHFSSIKDFQNRCNKFF